MEINSKEHEIRVLESVFKNFKTFFDQLGYKDFIFKSRNGDGVPDGIFSDNKKTIWIEHTQAKANYGKKGSIPPELEGFKIIIQQELQKENKQGCVCLDIPSCLADYCLLFKGLKSDILNIIKKVITEQSNYNNEDNNIYIKYCSKRKCYFKNINNNSNIQIVATQYNNIEFCYSISEKTYNKIIEIKNNKYKNNTEHRDENWLFIEIPNKTYFDNRIIRKSEYFDKIFIVERNFENGQEIFEPQLAALKENNHA